MTESTDKPKRRWYQFSLRTMLIIVTLAAIPLWLLGDKLAEVRRTRAAIDWLTQHRANFFVDQDGSWDSEFNLWLHIHVVEVKIQHEPEVTHLDPISSLRDLRTIKVDTAPVKDISALAEMKNLERVSLINTKVSDLSPLKNLTKLRIIDIRNSPVDDLSPLASLSSLEQVFLWDTHVTIRQVESLQQAIPNCEIVHAP